MFAIVMLITLSLNCASRTATRNPHNYVDQRTHLPRTHVEAGDEGAPRRRKQGRSGISNLPGQHNETGRDVT